MNGWRNKNSSWSHRLVVRTLASHAGSRGSNPLGTTNNKNRGLGNFTGPCFYFLNSLSPHYPPESRKNRGQRYASDEGDLDLTRQEN